MRRTLQVLQVLALAALIVLPALPASVGGTPSETLADWLTRVSFQQHWQMYAPNPRRALAYMNLTAIGADGREVELEETHLERGGWDARPFWVRTRVESWQQAAVAHPETRHRNRTWYMRGVCVRLLSPGALHDSRRRSTTATQAAGLFSAAAFFSRSFSRSFSGPSLPITSRN